MIKAGTIPVYIKCIYRYMDRREIEGYRPNVGKWE